MDPRPGNKKYIKYVMILLAAAVVAVILFFLPKAEALTADLYQFGKDILTNGEQLREWLLAQGPLAPLIFILLQILQVIFAPVPGEATGIIGGYLFGAAQGLAYSTIALTVGSGVAFALGRFLGTFFKKRYENSHFYLTFNHLVYKGDFVIPFVLFIIPGFPKDSLSYLLGMSSMPFKVFVFIAGVARIPGTLMLSFQGAKVYQEEYFSLIILIAVSLIIAMPCYIFRKKILALLNQYNNSDPHEN